MESMQALSLKVGNINDNTSNNNNNNNDNTSNNNNNIKQQQQQQYPQVIVKEELNSFLEKTSSKKQMTEIPTKKNVPLLPTRTKPQIPKKYDCEWFYLDDKLQQTGPITFQQLKDRFKKSEFTKDTYVYGPEDMNDWKPLNDLPEILNLLKI